MRDTATKLGLRLVLFVAAVLLKMGDASDEELEQLRKIRVSLNVTDLEGP